MVKDAYAVNLKKNIENKIIFYLGLCLLIYQLIENVLL